jgi:type II secretory pathway component GspD/PulD (secretin)
VKLTAEVHDLPWPLALEAVLEAHRLRPVQLASGVIKIVTEQSAREDQVVEEVALRFLTARDIQTALEGILRAGADSASARVEYVGDPGTTRRLVVYGSPEKISQVRSLVARLDRRPATISVENRIVNVDRTRMRRVGIMYALGRSPLDSTGTRTPLMEVRSTTPGGLQSTYGPAVRLVSDLGGLGRVDVNVFIDAVLGNGFAETQTTPFITTTSEMPAEVRIGDAIVLPNNQPIFAGGGYVVPGGTAQPGSGQPGAGAQAPPGGYGDGRGGLQPSAGGIYPDYGAQVGGFTRFETGTTLRVTPYALGDGLIRVRIELQRDGGQLSPDGRSITGGNQTAFTDVIVRDGSPIVMAGLTVNARSRARSGVPLLSDLPLLGGLFRVDEDAEHYQDLIIILTPRIESDESTPN